MKKLILLLAVITVTSCTENQRARSWGGKESITLKPNEVLLNVSWKQDDLWLITEDTVTHHKYAREKSSYGLLEGEIKIN